MSAHDIKQPDKVARLPDEAMYDILCIDLEWCWLETKDSVFLYLRMIDEPACIVAGRERRPYLAPDVVDEMQRLIRRSRRGKIWARDWQLMLLWAESLDEGLSLNKFSEEHAADGEDPRTLAKSITRLERRLRKLADALGERYQRYMASKLN